MYSGKEEYFDLKAFPRHHPTGTCGLHSKRTIKVTAQSYFVQRVMNKDERFSTDPAYIFMAQYYVERAKLESQISIAGRKGICNNNSSVRKVALSDSFNFLQKIRGTPKYWQNVSKFPTKFQFSTT